MHVISANRVVIDSRRQWAARVPFLPSPPLTFSAVCYEDGSLVATREVEKGGHEWWNRWNCERSFRFHAGKTGVQRGGRTGGGDKEPGLSLSSPRRKFTFR